MNVLPTNTISKDIKKQIQINPALQEKVMNSQFTWNDLSYLIYNNYDYEFNDNEKEKWTAELSDIFSCIRMI